jgi:hypothetical protein
MAKPPKPPVVDIEELTLGNLTDAEERGELEALCAASPPLARLVADLGRACEARGPAINIGLFPLEASARQITGDDQPPPRTRDAPRTEAEWQALIQEIRDLRAAGKRAGKAIHAVAKKHDVRETTLGNYFYRPPWPKKPPRPMK